MNTAFEILKHMAGSYKHRLADYLNGSTNEMVLDAMQEYAKIKMIEENKSLLEMAKLHMDSRAVMVISERISELEK